MPFHRMAIYYGQEFPYRQLIEDELTLADIPIFNPHGKTFKDAPVGGLLSGILNLVDSELPRRAFIDWINKLYLSSLTIGCENYQYEKGCENYQCEKNI